MMAVEATMRLRLASILSLLCVIGSVALSYAQSQSGGGTSGRAEPAPVVVVDVKGAIGVGTVHLIDEAFAQARAARAGLIVLRLDTPGGLVTATRDIIQAILASPVPVAVFVAPSGARAASAGTYISYAAHLAAMAPGTHLGAATPVQMGAPAISPQPEKPKEGEGAGGGAMERKITNDAVAYLRSLAQMRGRNADWAEKAVREAATLTAEEAERERVVDLLATSVADLLDRVDSRRVRTSDGEHVLATRHARLVVVEQGWKARVLAVLTDPNVAFILLMIGVYGIIFEFMSPGHVAPGVVGAICLVVGLMALSVLPLNLAGVALLVAGLAMMVAEVFVAGFGVLGVGGAAAFLLGGLFLFDPAGADIDLSVAWPVLIAAVATNALLLFGLVGMIMRVRRRKVVTGAEQMIGLEGEVLDWQAGEQGGRGRIRVHGEIWSARANQPLGAGTRVRVDRRDGLTLHVGRIGEKTQ
jgi:membrane-bound serine protease (ClpP class)